MKLSGELIIGSAAKPGEAESFHAVNPATGETLTPVYAGAGIDHIAQACRLAAAAFDEYRATTLTQRAAFLETIAGNIAELGDALIERAVQETGLPRGRIEGERGRTIGQLKLFAAVVREGSWLGLRVDPALPDRQPLPRPDLRLRNVAIGPVAVFGASNFPLAFSVAGGDTAAALAAGCPVVVKAHPAHPGTSELVGRAIQAAVAKAGLPEGVFSLLFGGGNALGASLVTDPRIKAVGFTGSRAGGMALLALAAARPEPIPVYAEMSSINPVLLMPAALQARAAKLGKEFAASLTMGSGQFCTNPGLVIARSGPALDQFIEAAREALQDIPAATMLHPGIFKAYETGVARVVSDENVQSIGMGKPATGPNQGRAALFSVNATAFLADKMLSAEIFGAASLVVTCDDFTQMRNVLNYLEGQLTATLQMDDGDFEEAKILLPVLESKAGRILVNGWPTGVEVSHAMVHGGPFPSTSDSTSTSVGTLAIERFLRPVCYQNFPDAVLPDVLRDENLSQSWRRVDGLLLTPV